MVETPAKSQLPQNDTVRCGMEVRVVCVCCVASWIFSVEALTTDGWGCFLWSGMKMKLDLTQAWIVVMNRSKWRHSYPHFTSKKRVDLWKQDERILWKSQVTIDLDWQITDYLRTPPILKIFYADRFQATLIKTFLHVASDVVHTYQLQIKSIYYTTFFDGTLKKI